MKNHHPKDGVPGALGLAVEHLAEKLGTHTVRSLWLFPPLRGRRREVGLVAVALGPAEEDRRSLVTVRYAAELTGRGVRFEPRLEAEGEAPADRLPRIIGGVVRRSELETGDPREVTVDGDAEVLQGLVEELMKEGDGIPVLERGTGPPGHGSKGSSGPGVA